MNKMTSPSTMWLMPLLLVMVMVGCESRLGLTSPVNSTTPSVSATNPADMETGVAFNNQITATFSEVMDSLTMTTATFTLMQGTSFVSGTVSYTGTTATFSPSGNLTPNTVYTATLTTGIHNLAGNSLANNHVWSFTTGASAAVIPPTVSSTDPLNAATNVPFNQKIAVTFSKTMDAATITTSTFTLTQGTTPISGFVSYSGTTALFSPTSNLAANTAYTATITSGAKDLAGNALAANYIFSFITGAAAVITPPTVSLTDPLNNATGVALNQKIAATFSKTMNASTITTATFILRQGTTPIPGFISYSGTMAIFAPAVNLGANTVYTATITTGVEDLAANALAANHSWSFTTGAAAVVIPPTVSLTDPLNLAVGVALNQKIAATFSKTMNASTITTATYILRQGTTPIPGFISYSGTTALFSPATNLTAATVYTATLTTGAEDLAGNALAANHSWNFTTGAAIVVTPPTINSTDPVDMAVGVALNQKISATFSKTMDPGSLTSATFTLQQGATSVSGFISYSGITALFTPAANLTANTVYTATITTGVKDLAGNTLAADHVWNFTTGAAVVVTPPTVSLTDPANLAINVALNQKIAATFSKTMDASTMTNATVTLTQGATPVAGFVSYSGTTVLFAPTANLLPATVYTATITTGVRDLANNALAANHVWSFTTGAAVVVTPPTVSLTDPLNLAIGVALNQKVAATFSKTMDASTITTATYILRQGTTPIPGFISYSGITALFTPAANLTANTVYTATITTGVKDLAGNTLAADHVWNFTTGAAVVVTPPTVSLTDPANLAINVALNQKIAATFSKTMDASTMTNATVTLTQGATPVAGFVSYSGTTVLFAPTANLLPATVYTATITTGVRDLANNALAANHVWSFTTGAAVVVTPPTVSLTDPLNLAIGVALNQKVAATFSKTMDVSTITTATFLLKQGITPVSGFISYSGTTALFAPSVNLSSSTLYTATITTGAKDLAGNALTSDYSWSFTTGAAVVIVRPVVSLTDPVNLAIAVPLNQKIAASFSKTMDPSSLTNATFTLKQGLTSIPGFVSYSGLTALFSPADNLEATTVYTATITTGAKDLAGNTLANNYSWSFTTGAAAVVTPPTVLSTDPLNLATGVAQNKHITALFSKTMDASTITTASFTLMQGASFVSGTVSYLGTTATFTPSSDLTPNTVYTATLTTGAEDLAGNPLSANHVWSFTTVVLYTLSLSSDPVTGGVISGEGTFISGTSVTALIAPNAGYTFTNWTLNGTEVSTSASYSFTLNSNKTLVANLVLVGPAIDLGAIAPFGGFGGSAGITNQGILTVVNGDLGTTAASTLITGFHDAGANIFTETILNIGTVNGVINCAPPAPGTAAKLTIAQQGLADATTAFNYLAGLPGGSDQGAGELGGLVLAPGTYTAAAGTFKITSGDLTLDAQNNPNAVWVFQMAQSLTVGMAGLPRSVILVNGALAENIFWQVGSAATINGTGGGTMEGTIISYSGVTFSTAGNVTLTTLNGRAISLNASVTMVNTVINVP